MISSWSSCHFDAISMAVSCPRKGFKGFGFGGKAAAKPAVKPQAKAGVSALFAESLEREERAEMDRT